MKIPTVEYCCCGFSLKLGTLLIAILALLGSLSAIARSLEMHYELTSVLEDPDLDDPQAVQIKDHSLVIQVFVYTCFVASVTAFLLAGLLVTGYWTSNRTLVRAWVIGTLSLQLLSLIANSVFCFAFGDLLYLLYNISVLINVYFVCVVNSYAQQMVKGSSSSIA